MSRYIDADKLEARINASPAFQNMGQDGFFLREIVLNIIDGQPTADVVEVVRCGQCKHWKINPHNLYGGYCRYCEGANIDHYCSYGGRKEKMRDRLIELINQKQVYGIDQEQPRKRDLQLLDNEELADHLLAEGVKVLPCEIGDTIYFVSRGEIIPMVVNCISFNGNYQYCLNCNYADEEKYGYSFLTFTDKVRGYMFGFTQEEAEKALAERSKNGT